MGAGERRRTPGRRASASSWRGIQQQRSGGSARRHSRGRAAAAPAAAGCGQAAGAARTRRRGRARPRPAPARTRPRRRRADDSEVVVAGLVGSGGGGLTALVFAAREGDLESAKLLLDAGADVNQTTEYGWTPLLTATNNRHYKLGEYLIERGADVNIANKGGWTPLYLATDNRNIEGGDYPVPKPDMDHLEFIKLLLDHGADPNAPGQGQHADAHDLHDAVVLRGRRDAVRARGAVERHGADEAAARLRAPIRTSRPRTATRR